MYRTDDPIWDAHRHDAEERAWRQSRPKCCECGYHIEDEYAYKINDEWLCKECLDRNYRKEIDDYADWE